jgi:hypothetical protein
MADIVKALKRPFSEVNKFLIGTLLGMIPIVNLIVIGYTLICTGFTKEKVERDSLPEWRNYGDLFVKGLTSVIIGIILFLPTVLILLGTIGAVIMSPAMSNIISGVSPETWNNLAAGQISDIQIENWFAENWTQFLPLLGAAPFALIAVILALLALYIVPVAVLGWLKEDRFSAAFSWKVIQKAMTLNYFVNWIVVGFITIIVNALLGWIPFLGRGITMYITGVFSYTVFAEVYERGQQT